MAIDLPDFIPGARVLIRATVSADDPAGLWVEIAGPRAPFTVCRVLVGPAEVYGPDPDEPIPAPLKVGERVTDERGETYELVGIRQRDDKQVIAMLWNDNGGAASDYLSNLARAAGE